MERFLFIFGLIVFGASLLFFVMNFIGETNGITIIMTLLGMLNASIAMGVSEILSLVKNKNK